MEFGKIGSVTQGVTQKSYQATSAVRVSMESFEAVLGGLSEGSARIVHATDAVKFRGATDQSALWEGAGLSFSEKTRAISRIETVFRSKDPITAYRKELPVFNGERMSPPVESFDLEVETTRLHLVRAEVEHMEATGEIDETLDMIVGLFGLKDRMTPELREQMKSRLMELAVGTRLQAQWAKAYPGYDQDFFDLRFDSIKDYLLKDEGKIAKISERESSREDQRVPSRVFELLGVRLS